MGGNAREQKYKQKRERNGVVSTVVYADVYDPQARGWWLYPQEKKN